MRDNMTNDERVVVLDEAHPDLPSDVRAELVRLLRDGWRYSGSMGGAPVVVTDEACEYSAFPIEILTSESGDDDA